MILYSRKLLKPLHSKGNIGAKPKAEVVADILRAIRERLA
jgi:molybdopterin/thiamine biosynthesis adenylyltransferase